MGDKSACLIKREKEAYDEERKKSALSDNLENQLDTFGKKDAAGKSVISRGRKDRQDFLGFRFEKSPLKCEGVIGLAIAFRTEVADVQGLSESQRRNEPDA